MNKPLQEAVGMLVPDGQQASTLARHIEAAIKSAVRAAVPGRQQQKNLGPLLEAAYKAAARTLRRRAKS